MASSEEAREEIRERLPIEQVVGEVVQLKRAGNSYKGLCPFHHEKTPSFYVTPSRGIYKCFGCGESGDIFSFVMKTRHLDFRDALRELAAKAGVTIDAPEQGRAEDTLRTRIYEMNAAAATYFQSMLQAQAGTRAREYLQRRAIAAATIDRFGLGYAPDTREGLCARLRAAGYSDEEMVAAGLTIAAEEGGPIRDRFRGRVIFPIRDRKGRILGFGGRVLGDGEPKYLNSPATPVFEKSRVLYAIEQAIDAIRGSREAVVVEGYMDALRAHQDGFPNVVATLGTAITDHQLQALAHLAPRLVLALDADPAGQRAAVKAGLAALGTVQKKPASGGIQREPVRVYVATLPEGQDPDDAIQANPEIWRAAIASAVPLMDHYFTLVEKSLDRTHPEWRQEAVDALVPEIGKLDGLGLQQSYIERLSALTGIDTRYLRDLTPGAAPTTGAGRREVKRRPATPPPPVPAADPIRVTEEYLLGLLLLHRPLSSDVRTELGNYTPYTPELAVIFSALMDGRDPGGDHDDIVERLEGEARDRPALAPHQVRGEVRVALARINAEKIKRDMLELGRVLSDVDHDTAREMAPRAAETMALREQFTTRLDREQTQRWRHPVAVPEPLDGSLD